MESLTCEFQSQKERYNTEYAKYYDIFLIDLNKIIDLAYRSYLQLINNYNLSTSHSMDCNRFFLHSLIKEMCNALIYFYKENNCIFYLSIADTTLSHSEQQLLKTLLKSLPFRYIQQDSNWECFLRKIEDHDAESCSNIEKILSKKLPSLRKFKLFLKKYGLVSVLDSYFTHPHSKVLLIG